MLLLEILEPAGAVEALLLLLRVLVLLVMLGLIVCLPLLLVLVMVIVAMVQRGTHRSSRQRGCRCWRLRNTGIV